MLTEIKMCFNCYNNYQYLCLHVQHYEYYRNAILGDTEIRLLA